MKTAKKAKKPVAAGKAVALKGAGDMSGPFQLSAAALAAKTPAALGLREGSARWALMKYAFAHAGAPLERADLARIAGAQLTQALSGCVRYRFLTRRAK